tara:strand:- start:382 stop:570 length:189 start_codon:yes stop_codon:yes gene_type:complete
MTTMKFNIDHSSTDMLIQRLNNVLPSASYGEEEVRHKIQCIIDDLEESALLNEVAMVAEIGE